MSEKPAFAAALGKVPLGMKMLCPRSPRTALERDFQRIRVWLLLPFAWLSSEMVSLFVALIPAPVAQWRAEVQVFFRVLALALVWCVFVPNGTRHVGAALRRLPERRSWSWILPAGALTYALHLLVILLSRGFVAPGAPRGIVLTMLSVLAVPVVEELIFRTLLFVRFRMVVGPSAATALSARCLLPFIRSTSALS